jgi:hypothetical protein
MTWKTWNNRDDAAWSERAQKWLQKKEELEALQLEEKKLREELIELAANQSSQGGGIRLTLSTRKGLIDYQSIPALKEIDLEKYRKPYAKVWTLSKNSS